MGKKSSYAKLKSKVKSMPKTSIILIFVVVVLLFVIVVPNLFSTSEITVTYTNYQISFVDYLDGADDDANDRLGNLVHAYWYECDISNVEADDLSSLTFEDFVLSDSGTGDCDFEIEDDYIYLLKANATGFEDVWYSTSYQVFGGNVPLLDLGPNTIGMMNTTADISGYGISVGAASYTFENTSYRAWDIYTRCLDSTEAVTSKVTEKEGYLPYYDVANEAWNAFTLDITTNATAAEANWVSCTGTYGGVISTSGAHIYIQYTDTVLYGESMFSIKFSSDLRIDFEISSVALAAGEIGSLTTFDTL